MFIILSVIVILVLIYFIGTRNFDYWEKKGIKHDKPYPFVGNSLKQMTFTVSFTDFFVNFYNKYKGERFIGLYLANRPALIVTEPRDVQRVLVSDFHCFYPRGVQMTKDDPEPLNKNLFSTDGDLWKLLRQRMTPVFTTSKLKAMFPLIVERAEKLQVIAADIASKNEEIDIKELTARFTTDFIGAVGFGLDMDTLEDENSVFRKLGTRIFSMKTMDIIRIMLKMMMPNLLKNVPSMPPEVTKTTIELVKGIMKERNYEPTERNDFIDQLLEVKKKGYMIGESIEKQNPDGPPVIVEKEFDDLIIAAQAFVFFAAGFETSSSNSSFLLHQLAFHPEKQRKCQEEIDEILNKYDGKLCYDAINDMKYLRMCFNESMRIFPSLGVLMRKTASKFTFPDSDLTIDEDVAVIVVNQAMQMDKKYFDEPEKFIPERFSPENAKNIPNHVYLPFGEGPRACIGERLGLMQSLAGLAAILSKFSVAPSKNSRRQHIPNPKSGFVQTVMGGVPLKLSARKKTD